MEATLNPDDITCHLGLSVAIAILVATPVTDDASFEERMDDVVSWALTLYHEKGRTDVDAVSPMLSEYACAAIEEAFDGGLRGEDLRTAIVTAIIDTFTVTCG